jgi:hypothetical protein
MATGGLQYRKYSLISLGLVATASIFLFAGTAYFSPARMLRTTVESLSTVDYLSNLHGRTEFGCRTFLEKRPDILFVGDSHTYSAFRFDVIGQALDARISACALGGFYVESMPLIFDVMKAADFFPKVIVLGASPRQFIEGRDKQSAIETHKFYLSTKYTVRDFIQDLITGKLGQGVIEPGLSHAADERMVAGNRDRFARLNAASATAYIARNHNRAYDSWRMWVHNAAFTADLHQKIDRLCEVVRENHSALYVIDIPESPYLRTEIYSEDIRRGYQDILRYFSSCAQKVITEPAAYYDLDDRYFLNRNMLDDFDFDKIARGEKLGGDNSGRDVDYDLDHMNIVGASLFSARITPMLQSIFREAQLQPEARRPSRAH